MIRFRDLKVKNQLLIGVVVLFLLISLLGYSGFRQSELIHKQTAMLYERPLQTRRSVSNIKIWILTMRLSTRDLMLAQNEAEKNDAINRMNLAAKKAEAEFHFLNDHYTGNPQDVERTYEAFNKWNIARGENTRWALSGRNDKVRNNLDDSSRVGKLRNELLWQVQNLDSIAFSEANRMYTSSVEQRNNLAVELIVLTLVVVAVLFVISFILLRSILSPVSEIKHVIERFHSGDMTARSTIDFRNEFGLLAESFNEMISSIQRDSDLSDKIMHLSFSMLYEEDSHSFFRKFLPEFCEMTNSQMAAVYILSGDKKRFRHYESVGLSPEMQAMTFGSRELVGEFGTVLLSKKIEIIRNIPLDTKFVYKTVSGAIVPRQIVTIPILAAEDVVAVVSLASIRTHSDESLQLITRLYPTLNARINGVLTFRKLNDFSKRLENQNAELAYRQEELATQSAILVEKNHELSVQKDKLAEASKLKTTFLTNMSHELRTPLNSVIALSGVLKRRLTEKIPSEEAAYLEVIERNGKNLLLMIDDILDIARIEAGRIDVELKTFSLNNLIDDVVSMVEPQATLNNNQIHFDKERFPVEVYSDENKCKHVLQNLIANAAKFTYNGWISIALKAHDSFVSVDVADSGIGIDEQHLPYIFDEFRQADSTTSKKYGGTGLGLAIAKKYATILGGTLSVKSSQGAGSVFTLTIPFRYEKDEGERGA